MQIPIEVGQPVVNITVQLAPGDSLGVDAKEAAARFGICETTLYKLRRQEPDFPSYTIGKAVRFLIQDLYVWFQTHPQTAIN